jgi:hypothetical protein
MTADVFAWEPQQPFDAVVMSFCHVPSPEKPAFFNKLATKFLKPGTGRDGACGHVCPC